MTELLWQLDQPAGATKSFVGNESESTKNCTKSTRLCLNNLPARAQFVTMRRPCVVSPTAENATMPINCANDNAFEPEVTALMGEAFEAACKELHFPKHQWARELVAARIIAAARRGELDPIRLRSAALVGMSHSVVLLGNKASVPSPNAPPQSAGAHRRCQ
jgi:hypothetical protein